MYAKRKLTEVRLKMKKFPPEPPHIMSKPQNHSDRNGLRSVQERRPELCPGSRASPEPVSRSHPSPSPAALTDVSLFAAASLHRTLSIQNLSQMEKPWENVTLNRCLFVAITILVLASGFQRLHGNHHSISMHP